MKILIIGGAGYIGSHVAREFSDKGFEITVLDNMSTGCKENLFKEEKFIECDILDYKRLVTACKAGFDGVVHLAAKKAAGESMRIPEYYAVNNITGTINILNAMLEANIHNIVFSSSAAVYGSPEYLPMDEKHPTKPENFYGYTKLEIENMLNWYDRLKGIKFAALRYFNAAGYDPKKRVSGLEQNPNNLLPRVMEVAINKVEQLDIYGDDYETPDGTCIRDYIHVTDLATAHIKALEYITKNKSSITCNLGTGKGISVKEIIENARRITKREIRTRITGRRAGDPATIYAASEEAYNKLQWQPVHSDVNSLITSMWEVYKQHLPGMK